MILWRGDDVCFEMQRDGSRLVIFDLNLCRATSLITIEDIEDILYRRILWSRVSNLLSRVKIVLWVLPSLDCKFDMISVSAVSVDLW